MKQRLGIAMALARQPKLLILDEPTNGLDPAGIEEIRELVRRLADDGVTVMVSSHLLGDLVERHGTVGDMVATMAHSPAVLGGYLGLSKAMRRAKLDRASSELISIAVQEQQGCGLCLASHIEAARSLGVADYEIELAQLGTATRPEVAAIIALGLQVYREPASITHEQVDELRGCGYSDRAIADVVGVVSLNILTGAFNLVAGLTPGDEGRDLRCRGRGDRQRPAKPPTRVRIP